MTGLRVNILGDLSPWRAEPSGMARPTDCPAAAEQDRSSRCSAARPGAPPMEAFLVSITTVAVAEMGDRTQLLSLVLAAHYRKPWPIIAGVLVATLANHALAGLIGVWFGTLLTARVLDFAVGVSMLGMALWTLRSDRLEDGS